jgi:immunity protein, SdpI family
MRMDRLTYVSFGLVVLAFALVAAAYNDLPAYVPTHWNASGAIDAKMAKPWGPFLLPLTMAGMFVLLLVLPHISPRGYAMTRFRRAYGVMQLAILGFFFALNVVVLLAAFGWAVPMNRVVLVGAGALLIVIGNLMGKVTTNFFVGIRTPWTLADPEVWLRTHRFGGKALVVAGLMSATGGLLGADPRLLAPAVLVVVIAPAVYSYVIYRRLERERAAVDRP